MQYRHFAADLASVEQEPKSALQRGGGLLPTFAPTPVKHRIEDIRKNGQQVPIELFGGKIIDGRRRFKACGIAGVQPKFRDVSAVVTDPITYVMSLNLHRRHLAISQLAMVAAKVREIYERQAKERMKEGGGDKKSTTAKSGMSPAAYPIEGKRGATRDIVGATVGVTGTTVDKATKVLKQAVPEVIEAVEQGRMTVTVAARLAEKPEDEQREVAAKPNAKATAPKPEESEPEPDAEPESELGRKNLGKGVDCLGDIFRGGLQDGLRGFELHLSAQAYTLPG